MSQLLHRIRFSLPVFLILLVACGPATPNAVISNSEPTTVLALPTSRSAESESVPPTIAVVEEPTVETAVVEPTIEAVIVDQDNETLGDGYYLGAADAPVTIIEYSDYQCPFCQRHTLETLPLIKEQFIDTGRLRYEFRDFPIASLHPFAYRMHEAAYCAADVNGVEAFWEAHELFFTQVDTFKADSLDAMNSVIVSTFAQNGLPDVSDCLLENRHAERVATNITEGEALGVRGTPSFFVEGYQIAGAQAFTTFSNAIVAAETGTLADYFEPPPEQAAVDTPGDAPLPVEIEIRPKTGLGDPAAAVKIIEFSDYQCPFCQRHALETMPAMKQLVDDGRVYYEFRDFPIASIHPLAYLLHEAALCVQQDAGVDGFWTAHDLFFSRAESFKMDTVDAMGQAISAELGSINLWTADVESCYANRDFADEVAADVAEGNRLRITGTPSFFINGYLIVGAQPFQSFEQAVILAEDGRLAEAMRPVEPTVSNNDNNGGQPLDVPISGEEPVKGAADAPVTIVEYSSYQCPFCKRYFDETMPFIEPYIADGTVRYIFKDFPLPTQPQAYKVHEAAHCAHEQGDDAGYWEFHDIMFTNQSTWSSTPMGLHIDVIKELARTAEFLDGEAFDTCLDEGRYIDRVNADLQEGAALNVRGTPSFFINGAFISGAQPFEVFKQAIENALAQ